MVNVLSIVSVVVLTFSAVNVGAHEHAHAPRHRGRGDAIMRRVPFGREMSPDLTPFEIRKKRGSGHNARRCNAQDTTSTSTSTSTPWTTPTWSSTSSTSSSVPVLKEHQKVSLVPLWSILLLQLK